LKFETRNPKPDHHHQNASFSSGHFFDFIEGQKQRSFSFPPSNAPFIESNAEGIDVFSFCYAFTIFLTLSTCIFFPIHYSYTNWQNVVFTHVPAAIS